MKNLPNRLTLSRIAMVPFFLLFAVRLPSFAVAFFSFVGLGGAIAAVDGFILRRGLIVSGVIFLLAFATDFIDGYVARKYKQVTDFGIFLDPIADKLLVSAALVALTSRGIIGAWITTLIISREFIVTGIRLLAMNKGVVLAAGGFGKAKTFTQAAALILLLFSNFNLGFLNAINAGGTILYIALIFTVLSGADYIIKNRSLFK